MGIVVDQLGTCHTMRSIVLSLWAQRPLLFVLYSSLPAEPISPNISLTTSPVSDWCTEFFAISKVSVILFVFHEFSFQPLSFQGFCLLAISIVLIYWLTILVFALVRQSQGNAKVWTTLVTDGFFLKEIHWLGLLISTLTSSPQAPQRFPAMFRQVRFKPARRRRNSTEFWIVKIMHNIRL